MFDDLRISLLLLGTLIILAIYLWDVWQEWRRKRKRDDAWLDDDTAADEEDGQPVPLLRHALRGEPVADTQLRDFAGFSGRQQRQPMDGELDTSRMRAGPSAADREPGIPDEQMFVLTVFTQQDAFFTGATLSDLFDELGLEYGEQKMFQRQTHSGIPVFSIISILEPGHFDLARMHELRTPGLALFMRLPGALDGGEAFEDMYATAQKIAAAGEGRLGDQDRNLLTTDVLQRMRTDAARFLAGKDRP